MTATGAGLVLAWALLILLAFAVAGLLRMVRELQATVAGLGASTATPLTGRRIDALAGEPTASLVVDPACTLCRPQLEVFDTLPASYPRLRLQVVSYRRAEDWPEFTGPGVLIDEDLFGELDLPWVPALVVTDSDGVIVHARPVLDPSDLAGQLSSLPAVPTPARS